ncbi:hypothetical protein BFJ66_g16176 [Fusarium oxysporum f. sp. cepae]|uniref:PD-(D/E)XK nuclease-like domain-containing protein n=1 Tax=Fusarium oxysporum f. sp. cepae TaxID=396571 RepID=A0A3L6MTB3_FUSOX|nr:hypothetical protein BFJ65_g18274 [Fusarium oxysporum f. sp. cepae]RKK30738.1 hypothetical protein BFJ66_g16176 [Fusarium oxysporum f. sp. cepae]RKK36115.1 hypothetical protein BFJ67_g12965 [Fusarium oxysporum f. sp. cepae]
MVNFALALIPDETLQATIDKFFKTQWHNTLNQRAYTALASRPAPLFIETRTTSSTADRSKVQLGIWVAAWYQRLRDANSAKNPTSIALMQYVLPPPVGKAYPDVMQTLIDQAIRIVDTASIVGMYQLLTALRVIRKWADTEFCTCIGDFLANIEIPSQ